MEMEMFNREYSVGIDNRNANSSMPSQDTTREAEFKELKKAISVGRNEFFLIDCSEGNERNSWINRINQELRGGELRIGNLDLSEKIPDAPALLSKMSELSQQYDVVHVLNGTEWFKSEGRWESANFVGIVSSDSNRPTSWLFWGDAELIGSCARQSPELWDRRKVFSLARNADAAPTPPYVRADQE
jgi:hypothetical protein